MFRSPDSAMKVACLLMFACLGQVAMAEEKFPGVGRTATPAEIAAWDIDVRPDFKGLPPGRGSVARGQQVWEAKCESCHGAFGEASDVFAPIAGGVTKADIAKGRVANLTRDDYPQRTTLMKLAHVSTLWDYINRAMPWNAPKSLSTDDVYAVTAYVLNLDSIVPSDFVLSDKNIASVQATLPNRHGMKKFDAMWEVGGKGDIQNKACMKDCKPDAAVTSALPVFARNSHGNLAQQSRVLGSTRGAGTMEAAGAAPSAADAEPAAVKLANKHSCNACHAVDRQVVGPSYAAIGKRYRGEAGIEAKVLAKLRAGGAGAWGAIPMPAQSGLPEDELLTLVRWVLSVGS